MINPRAICAYYIFLKFLAHKREPSASNKSQRDVGLAAFLLYRDIIVHTQPEPTEAYECIYTEGEMYVCVCVRQVSRI